MGPGVEYGATSHKFYTWLYIISTDSSMRSDNTCTTIKYGVICLIYFKPCTPIHSCVILEVTIHGVNDHLIVYQYGVRRNLGLLTIRSEEEFFEDKNSNSPAARPLPYSQKL